MPADPSSFLPLTNLAFQILLSIAHSDRHGYAIIKDIEARTGGAVKLRSGTLYTAIQRLVDAGLVRPVASPVGDDESDNRRRYYRVSEIGLEVAALESERLAALLRTARDRELTAATGTRS